MSKTNEITIDDMRHALAVREAETMQESDVVEILLDGFVGLDNFDDIDIRDEYENLFGKSVDNPE